MGRLDSFSLQNLGFYRSQAEFPGKPDLFKYAEIAANLGPLDGAEGPETYQQNDFALDQKRLRLLSVGSTEVVNPSHLVRVLRLSRTKVTFVE
jgi:hypothetical protein